MDTELLRNANCHITARPRVAHGKDKLQANPLALRDSDRVNRALHLQDLKEASFGTYHVVPWRHQLNDSNRQILSLVLQIQTKLT